MKILAIDCSSRAASAALADGFKIVGEVYINAEITHSQTLMPSVKSLLENTRTELNEIDALAVTTGPGSYTGLRIGISAVKGMAHGLNKPCIGVSTLHSLAYNLYGQDCIGCAVMDARQGQLYSALFRLGDSVTRLTPDTAITIEDLKIKLTEFNEKIVLVGDGANLLFSHCEESGNIAVAPETRLLQRASSVALIAAAGEQNPQLDAEDLNPTYLRAFF